MAKFQKLNDSYTQEWSTSIRLQRVSLVCFTDAGSCMSCEYELISHV